MAYLNRDNNFQLIRFIAASMVLFSHSFALTGSREPLSDVIGVTCAEMAVDIFFVVSGFLVTSSLLHRKKLSSFFWARILRIYPALIVNSFFCAFIVGMLFTSLPVIPYLTSTEIYSFVLINSSLLGIHPSMVLPGVFDTNVYRRIINGSLWTLPWEIKAYASLALLAFLWPRRKELLIVIVTLLSVIMFFAQYLAAILDNPFYIHGFRFASFFFAGSVIYIYREHVPFKQEYLLLSLIMVLLSAILKVFVFTYIILLPYIVISSAYLFGGFIRNFNKLGDYSYGMYLFAFPIQQSIFHLFPGISIQGMFSSAFVITLLFAICSWHLIEKKCLSFKDSYVKNSLIQKVKIKANE